MNLLVALLLTAAPARVEAVNLTALDSQLAVRVALSGRPGMVSVHREGGAARVSIAGTGLGSRFAGGSRFSWVPAPAFDVSTLTGPTRLDRLEVVATDVGVSVLLHVPPEVSIDTRRDRRGLLLILREAGAEAPTPTMARATPPAAAAVEAPPRRAPAPVTRPAEQTPPPAPEPEPVQPEPSVPEPIATPPAAVAAAPVTPEPMATGPASVEQEPPPQAPTPSSETAELARGLFPTAAASGSAGSDLSRASVSDLYAQLFPSGAPQTAVQTVEPVVQMGPDAEPGVPFGPFRVKGSVDIRYIDADTFVEASGEPVRDRYLEVVPHISATTPVSDGQFRVEYVPFLRAFATYDQVNTSSHRASASLDLPLGPAVVLNVNDSFVSGTLDTRDADPGGEYFFGLGRFRRNTFSGGASIVMGQRASLELEAGATSLRFQEPSNFFGYDRRVATAGVGYELSPNLKAIVAYRYDHIPVPEERREAESTAHNAELTLQGDVMPLLNGEVTVGYRRSEAPNAGEGGKEFSGFTMRGALTKRFTRKADMTVFVNRSTPPSAFEENAFYVFTALQASGRFPLPLQLQAQGGLGYQWNDYRTVSMEIGAPREDRILAWYVGLRRPVSEHFFLSATYRRQERRSNIDRFEVDADGFILQLEWDIFGNTP